MTGADTIFDPATVATILKWAVMILVTGFIAHFGKQLAEYIINKIRNARGTKTPGTSEAHAAAPAHPGGIGPDERARLKLKKKLAKAAAKESKKKS